MPEQPNSLLQGRYQLKKILQADEVSESWLGYDEDRSAYLIKLWRYQDQKPDDPARALWNSELRTLYRLCSSPGAEESILIMRDAGIDPEARAFVMVLESEDQGYENLATALANRNAYPWLKLKSLRQMTNREQLWQGLRRLADGIQSLHMQHVIHRNIDAETVYFDPAQGPNSWRLGGFEWSVRLGHVALNAPSKRIWATPPEWSPEQVVGYTFDTDWYAFGMLAARCFYFIEKWSNRSPADLNRRVYREVEHPSSPLSDIERNLIQRLIAPHPTDRLTFAKEILSSIDEILLCLTAGVIHDNQNQELVLVIDHKNLKLLDTARNNGFQPDPKDSYQVYSRQNPSHVVELKRFLRQDLEEAWLYALPSRDRRDIYLLVGQRLTWQIGQYEDKWNEKEPSWDAAFVIGPGELRGSDGSDFRELKDVSISVVTLREVASYSRCQSWQRYLPRRDQRVAQNTESERFHEFLRCTNQLELLMRDAEIFPYCIKERQERDGFEHIYIEKGERERPVPKFCEIEGGLPEFLQRELRSNKPNCREVLLTKHARLRVPRVSNDDWWEIVSIHERQVELKRRKRDNNSDAPKTGYIRTYGLYGQVALIARRKKAIDRLQEHSYLLRSLAQPGMVSMDTGTETLPYNLPPEKVDASKIAVIHDIQRVRPIYTLQGPPGTGKTTLVAYLLREIIQEDPVAQILVTAQAHGAVDVLRKKVRKEAFSDVDENALPIAIRLKKREKDQIDGPDEDESAQDTVEQVTNRLLKNAHKQLDALTSRSPIQEEWYELLSQELTAESGASDRFISDFQQLVKRGASITYCTTSASDLADLAESSQSFDWSFDWSIVEEAGKAHGFDLALPLQAGHRWLLLGDHKQLPPYRYEDYRQGIDELDKAVESLHRLPDRSLLDTDWIHNWRERNEKDEDQDRQKKKEQDKEAFKKRAKRWLNTFERLFLTLSRIQGPEQLTETEAIGAKAGRLKVQYRMHPTVGDLISETFYKGTVDNGTIESDGTPKASVCHPFENSNVGNGYQIKDKAIVWIDMPWCQHNENHEELGPKQGKPRYTNEREVQAVKGFLSQLRCQNIPEKALKIAVLSPYNQQVGLLNKRLADSNLPDGLELLESLPISQRGRWAHTVDSFQGNQADVIIVSLVRNNTRLAPDGLGFLRHTERINVLLSRAEKLLVLVGSWDFFDSQLKGIDIYEQNAPLWPWKKLLDMLTQYFKDGRAVKIPYRMITDERN